jgi:maltose O-acetyltransferase
MGPNVTIHSSNHNYNIDNVPFMYQGHKDQEVIIGNNVWLGASVIILPGVQICDNVVVGAGAIVTKSIFNAGVYAGNPAKFIKSI